MKKVCNYHPTQAAHWSCGQCGGYLCPACVSKRDSGGYGSNSILHFCPKCNLPVDWVGVSNLIDPFWKRLPRIFLYPLSMYPLMIMAICTVVQSIFNGPGLLNWLIQLAAGMVLLKYAFEALKATSSGNLKQPKITAETVSRDIHIVLKQYVIIIAMIVAGVILWFRFGGSISGVLLIIIFGIFCLFFLPSMIILLVTSGSFFHAINPVMFIGLTFRIGWPYLLMIFFLMLLQFAPLTVGGYIFQFFPQALHLPMQIFTASFYVIVCYHLMGYVILQYHERIGYQVDFEDFADPSTEPVEAKEVDPDAPVLNAVNPLIQDGKLDEAISQIKQMTKSQGIKGVNLSERYYNLLKMKKRTEEMVEYGDKHLDLLVAENNKSKALQVYAECLKLRPDFLPGADALFKLGGWLNENGKTKPALGLYNRLIKEYPQNPIVPKTYFRVAQIFHDRLMNIEKARKMLGALKSKYPEHDIIPHVENYLANI
jgi:tetratricopeptide (TPR) repeat protein